MTNALTKIDPGALNSVRLDKLTPEKAVELCKESPELAAHVLMAVVTQNTAELPGTAFVRRQGGEVITKQRVGVRLTESEGHLIRMPARRQKDASNNDVWVPQWEVSLEGIRRINEVASLMPVRPETVMVDGERRMNPFIQIDPKTRMPEVVYARCLCIGYGPMGTLVATDAMIRLDLNIYLLENIQSKMKRLKSNAGRLAQYGTQESKPEEDGHWVFMPMHGAIGMWVNVSAPEWSETFGDHTTRLKFIERLAQSFAERNAFKAHPGLPKSLNVENGLAHIAVTMWTNQFERRDIDQLRTLIEHDKLDQFKDSSGRGIAIESVPLNDSMDEGDRASLETEFAKERALEGKTEDEADVADPAALLEMTMEHYGLIVDMSGRERAKELLAQCGVESLEEATNAQLRAFVAATEEELGEG